MAFFRFNRDKRGYEHFYLVEPITNRRGKSRPRVLYWYRTPPNIKVGRVPFDDEVQRALEAQNPTVVFDWRKIVNAPIPSADVEKWRDRRRAERAEKAARRAAAGGAVAEAVEPSADAESAAAVESAAAAESGVDEAGIADEMSVADDESIDAALETAEAVLASDAVPTPAAAVALAGAAGAAADSNAVRKRRRRRRRRGRRREAPSPAAAPAVSPDTATAANETPPVPTNPDESSGE